MAVFIPLIAVLALGYGAYWGAQQGLTSLFGIVIPYVTFVVFLLGFAARIINWAKTPVPFNITTTSSQQQSLPWIKYSPLDNPPNAGWTAVRMVLEIGLFRSLFRNTTMYRLPGPKIVYNSAKWLWFFAMLFHYALLTIVLRHLRLFLEPVPCCIKVIEVLDGLFQVGVPRMYQTDIVICTALLFLLGRRLFSQKINYISLAADYFPLMLILGICGSGIWMRYFSKTDISMVKVLTMSLVTLKPTVAEGVSAIFYMHIFLVSVLMAYFPFSKLMHLGGVFLSPTRNLPNNSRVRHHKNPWNPPKKFYTYEIYEDDFRELMIEAGLPVEKQPAETAAE
ncbi:Hdr-like menaquinol oxidoreductase cytochrome b-like subunit [Desulfovibrionales bacterium]